MTVLYIFYII